MTCFHPIQAYRSRLGGVVFSRKNAYIDRPLKIPCGQCVGCRLERSRQWAIRCVHEASLHQQNSFVTLTYDDEHLPADKSLHLEDFQLFMKRLRKKFVGKQIRFYHCGEYGEQTFRPHYHVCFFGLDFDDKIVWKKSRNSTLYNSEILTKLWGKGYAVIGDVTFESAAYVARYIMKKVTGKNADEHYTRCDLETGEIFKLKPEYTTMSRRPGIANNFFEKYKNEIYRDDFIVMNNKKMRPPRYYDRSYEIIAPDHLLKIKSKRIKKAKKFLTNNTDERLLVREKLTKKRVSRLARSDTN
jgi:hypothetical protein